MSEQYLNFIDHVERAPYLISDGGIGTYLQSHGLEPGDSPEKLNLTQPTVVRQMAQNFFDAGSDMVLTNSFGGNKFMLKKYGVESQLHEINREAASLGRMAAGNNQWVIGSIGPSGAFLQPLGDVSPEEMHDAFAAQAQALEEGGANAILVETMTSLDEITIAIDAIHKSTALPILATMTFDKGPRGYFSMMGVTPHQTATELSKTNVAVLGANCGNGIDQMTAIFELLIGASSKPVLIHSNAGIPKIVGKEVVYNEEPEYMAEYFISLIERGAKIVGGCCGVTPKHIEALRNLLTRKGLC